MICFTLRLFGLCTIQFSMCTEHITNERYAVTIAGRTHLFPYRTQKLSSLALMILGGRPPGKAGRCRLFLFLCLFVNSQHNTYYQYIAVGIYCYPNSIFSLEEKVI